jgi:hypothetical protein
VGLHKIIKPAPVTTTHDDAVTVSTGASLEITVLHTALDRMPVVTPSVAFKGFDHHHHQETILFHPIYLGLLSKHDSDSQTKVLACCCDQVRACVSGDARRAHTRFITTLP